ncbi:MAG: hypothetical protein J0H34_22475 [Rhizobiales bacterium]|nr:hypothetical protein [Hyphomicrobiales bacterium]
MTELLEQIESSPTAYPPAPDGLSTAAAALANAMLWQRIELWVAYRWTERIVVWIMKGPGHFEPLLLPASIGKAEVWQNDAWQELTLPASPLGGLRMIGDGPYRFTATVGGGTVPESVNEAYRRLAEYWVAHDGAGEYGLPAGVRSFSHSVGDVSVSLRGEGNWQGRAMEGSGAADLLRPYRRLGRC